MNGCIDFVSSLKQPARHVEPYTISAARYENIRHGIFASLIVFQQLYKNTLFKETAASAREDRHAMYVRYRTKNPLANNAIALTVR
jgi:hypothetical protein